VRAALLLAFLALLLCATTAQAASVQVVAREQGLSPHSGPLIAPGFAAAPGATASSPDAAGIC
jgi:hypothetical protein